MKLPNLRRHYIAALNERVSRIGTLPFRMLIALWFCSMAALPIADWLQVQPAARAALISLNTLLFAAAAVLLLWQTWGSKRTLLRLWLLLCITWLVEFIGSQTGFPFGRYHYTQALQPQLGGVPLLIPAAWLTLLPASWAMAHALTGQATGWRFCLSAAAFFTAWDLFLDPQMVQWGLWVWEQPGWYFGIPLQNYVGWFATAALVSYVLRPPAISPSSPTFLPAVIMYGLTWAFELGGQLLIFGLPGPAICGGLAMGLGLWAVRQPIVASWQRTAQR